MHPRTVLLAMAEKHEHLLRSSEFLALRRLLRFLFKFTRNERQDLVRYLCVTFQRLLPFVWY